jgi:magnesium-transporting ATPase (P-type)
MKLLEVEAESADALDAQLIGLENEYVGPETPVPRGWAALPGWCGGVGGPPCPSSPLSGPPLNSGASACLVVTGPALSLIMDPKNPNAKAMAHRLLRVGNVCKSVLACRTSPAQKASIVELVKKGVKPTPLTLSIGDGANDVGMIQTADVGVGISGKEGLQAANSADFAIAQFRFLKRLLLVHGRWDYRRLTKVVLYSFYKNVVITLTLFFFNALAGFSGTSMYESIIYATYNFVLGLPIIAVGVLDQDVREECVAQGALSPPSPIKSPYPPPPTTTTTHTCLPSKRCRDVLKHPMLYGTGREFSDLNVGKLLLWGASAIVHGVLVFWLVFAAFSVSDTTWDYPSGVSDGLDLRGLTTFFVMTWTMQLTVGLEVLYWTRVHTVVLAISQVGFLLFAIIYNVMFSASVNFYGVAYAALSRPAFYLLIALVMGTVLALELAARGVRLALWPRPEETARLWSLLAPPERGWGDELTPEERARVAAARTAHQHHAETKNGLPTGSLGTPSPATFSVPGAQESTLSASGDGAESWRQGAKGAPGKRWPSAVGAV